MENETVFVIVIQKSFIYKEDMDLNEEILNHVGAFKEKEI
jgi:hypothetical protein